jgi:glycosyltransferase involved in cell wall biosynthesis
MWTGIPPLHAVSSGALKRKRMAIPHQPPSKGTTASALVVIPCLNEEEHLEGVIDQLLAEADHVNLTIIVADGGSTDGSRAIARNYLARDHRVVLMDNPKRIQSAGVNRAVEMYGGDFDFLIRVDAHARYPTRFCERLFNVQARTRADSVVVSMHTVGRGCFQCAVASAQNSILGNGGALHRNVALEGWVDHGHHALITIKAFKAVGGYDESFSHVEDVELDIRLRAAGFSIFLTGEVDLAYFPRRTIADLFRQYRNVGRGRMRNFLKHRKEPKVRHLILAAVAPALGLLLLTPFSFFFALPALSWALLCLGYGLLLAVHHRDPCTAAAGIAAMVMQFGWSVGFFEELKVRLWQADGVMQVDGPTDKSRTSERITR